MLNQDDNQPRLMASKTGNLLPVRTLLQSVGRLISSVNTYFEGLGQVVRELCHLREELLALKGILQLLRAYRSSVSNKSDRLIVNTHVLTALADDLQTAQNHLGDPIFPSRLRPIPPWPIPVNEHEQIVARLAASRRCLETLLTHSLYEKLLARPLDIERDLLRKAFIWLACSVRPLTVAELAEAIMVRDGVYEHGPADRLPRSTDILDIGGSLFLCDSRTRQVRFAHSSLRNYLFAQATKTGPAATFALSEDECHRQILISCLTYIQLDAFAKTTHPLPELAKQLEVFRRSQAYPLYRYCMLEWTKHVTNSGLDEMVPHHAPRLLQSATTIASYTDCRRQLERGPKPIRNEKPELTYADPVRLAVKEGLFASVKALLAMRGNLNARNECEVPCRPPLSFAIVLNRFEITRLLLDASPDVISCPSEYRNAIQIAARAGFLDILRLLLDRADELHLDISSAQNHGGVKESNLLYVCSGTGDLECAKLLLSRDAGPGVSHREVREAIKNRHFDLAQLLLGQGTISVPRDEPPRLWLRYLLSEKDERAVELIRYCLQQKLFCVSDHIDSGQTSLHLAAGSDNTKVVQLLLEAGADLNAKSLQPYTLAGAGSYIGKISHSETTFAKHDEHLGDTALHCATTSANLPTIQLLVQHGADLQTPGSKGLTPVQLALFNHSVEVVNWAIDLDADVNLQYTSIDPAGKQGETCRVMMPVWNATQYKNWNIVKLLLASGAFPGLPISSDEDMINFFDAACHAPASIFELVLNATSDIKKVLESRIQRKSIIENPIVRGSTATVQLLLSRGADIEQRTDAGQTLLASGAFYGHLSVVEALLASGADANAKSTQDGNTAMMIAAEWPRQCRHDGYLGTHFPDAEDDVRMYGSPYVNVQPDLGLQHKSAMHYLINHAPDVLPADQDFDSREKLTGMILTARQERINIIRALVRAGADVNAANHKGETALHKAAKCGSKAIVKVLLGYGADIYARNGRGFMPLRIAQARRTRQSLPRESPRGVITLLAAMHQLAGDGGSWVEGRFILD